MAFRGSAFQVEILFLSADCHNHDSEQYYAGSDLLSVQRPHVELDWDLASPDRPALLWSAILIFLLRQNFKSIPRDLDEAAMLDAGPLRILISVILPQSIPVVTTVALLHFFYIWNDTRLSSLYLAFRPDLQLISFAVQRNQSYFFTLRR